MASGNFFDFREAMTRKPRRMARERAGAAPHQRDTSSALTVSELTARIDQAIQSGLPGQILVRGELGGWKFQEGSGHCYFTLKDARSCIDGVLWKRDAGKLRFEPKPGMEVLVSGKVQVYAPRGRYQLSAVTIEPIGQGALELAFRQLHARLEAEGLFAAERKKPLPPYPMRIALVTSRETAALQDMLKVLRRFAWLRLMIYHVPVQGDGAAGKIADALRMLNTHEAAIGGVDLILLGRGGGSLEDLWQFNEEVLARAIAASRIPIVTGIGHEVDVSIADLAADYHAHTPTEAAQVASGFWKQAAAALAALGNRLGREGRNRVRDARLRLAALERHDIFRRPLLRIDALRQRLDDHFRDISVGMLKRLQIAQRRQAVAAARLERCRPSALLGRMRQRLQGLDRRVRAVQEKQIRLARLNVLTLERRLRERHPRHAIALHRQRLVSLVGRCQRAGREDCARHLSRLRALASHLAAVSPDSVLQRGFTLTLDARTGRILRRVEEIREGQRLRTRFADGEVESTAGSDGGARQLDLFGKDSTTDEHR